MGYFAIRFRSVNCYLVEAARGLLAFDAGWPGSFREYRDALKEKGRRVEEISWLIASHFHIDHAGLAGEFQERGVSLALFPNQAGEIDGMEALIRRKGYAYRPVDLGGAVLLDFGKSREWLESLGVGGRVVRIESHSGGSVCLLLDGGIALSGDLAPPGMVGEYDEKAAKDWETLRSMGATRALPAHGPGVEL